MNGQGFPKTRPISGAKFRAKFTIYNFFALKVSVLSCILQLNFRFYPDPGKFNI